MSETQVKKLEELICSVSSSFLSTLNIFLILNIITFLFLSSVTLFHHLKCWTVCYSQWFFMTVDSLSRSSGWMISQARIGIAATQFDNWKPIEQAFMETYKPQQVLTLFHLWKMYTLAMPFKLSLQCPENGAVGNVSSDIELCKICAALLSLARAVKPMFWRCCLKNTSQTIGFCDYYAMIFFCRYGWNYRHYHYITRKKKPVMFHVHCLTRSLLFKAKWALSITNTQDSIIRASTLPITFANMLVCLSVKETVYIHLFKNFTTKSGRSS